MLHRRLKPLTDRPSRLSLLTLLTGLVATLLPAGAGAALAPCAGPLELSARSNGSEQASVAWKGRRCAGRLEVSGEVRFDDDLRLTGLAPGAYLRGEETVGGSERKISVRPGADGAPAVDWWLDGEEARFDADARAWLAEHLLLLLRQTGYQAEERVARLLDGGGAAALLAEVAAIDSDRTAARYVEIALARPQLGDAEAARLIGGAARAIGSDAELAGLLAAAAGRPGASDAVLEAVAAASAAVGSDADRRRVLAAGLAAAATPAARTALLAAAAGIASDGDLAGLLVAAVDRLDLGDEGERRAFAAAAATLGSDADHARVLAAVAARPALPAAALAMVLESAAGIGSDGDLARLLVTVAERHPLDGELRAAYLRTARTIGSDADRRRAVEAL